jgi:hypothetical protein
VLAALVAASGVLAALEWLVYGARALPRSPTVAILARVEWAYLALWEVTLGLMLYQFIWESGICASLTWQTWLMSVSLLFAFLGGCNTISRPSVLVHQGRWSSRHGRLTVDV